jgi:hypothetical protein
LRRRCAEACSALSVCLVPALSTHATTFSPAHSHTSAPRGASRRRSIAALARVADAVAVALSARGHPLAGLRQSDELFPAIRPRIPSSQSRR